MKWTRQLSRGELEKDIVVGKGLRRMRDPSEGRWGEVTGPQPEETVRFRSVQAGRLLKDLQAEIIYFDGEFREAMQAH